MVRIFHIFFQNEEETDYKNRLDVLAENVETLITTNEIEKLKNRKATGKDKINNELLKYGGMFFMAKQINYHIIDNKIIEKMSTRLLYSYPNI